MEPATIRILVADDHPVVRGGLVALLGTIDGIDVAGEAADGEAAVTVRRSGAAAVPAIGAVTPGVRG